MKASLSEKTFDVLSRNGVFYCEGPEDKAQHYIDVATLKQFAEEILKTVVVPLLSAGLGAAISEIVKSKLKKDKEKSLTTDDFVKLWQTVSQSVPLEKNPLEQVKIKLQYHGWPKQEAEEDAAQVLKLAVEQNLQDGTEDEKG